MKERPILFSGPMVRAILEGTKTQTRRVMDRQPESKGCIAQTPADELWYLWPCVRQNEVVDCFCKCRYGQPGDRLWVRETVALVPATAYRGSDGVQQTPNPDDPTEVAIYRAGWDRSQPGTRWRPSIHMPRWASRITLEITGVRVERVQEISEADMYAEGLDRAPYGDPSAGFQVLWDEINGSRGYGWASNPWVWVLEFQRV